MVGGLRAVGVGSSSELAEAPQPLFSCTAVQALLAAAQCPTSSRPHAGLHNSTDTGAWKLWCGLLGALDKDEPVSHAAAAIR